MLVCPQCGGTYTVTEGFCPMDGTPLSAEPPSATVSDPEDEGQALCGRVLERRYRLDRRIGSGAMGYVYRATHTLIGKTLAIKVLRNEHAGDPKVIQRFAQEARLASRIKHPNVVEINDFGALEEGNAYFVMELLEGRTLADLVDDEGPLAPKTALSVALQIARGLGAAHAEGIVHRDLKAENVFLCDGSDDDDGTPFVVKLLDFGIARAADHRITMAGALLGTPEYMSPEQAQGREVDARTDLYALGIILFEMLTGRVPFSSKTVADTLRKHMHVQPPSLHEASPQLAKYAAIGEVIRTLLAKSPDERPQTAAEAVTSLRRAMEVDFGAETADRLHRSTLALGSEGLSERPAAPPSPAPEKPMGWGARTGRTQQELSVPAGGGVRAAATGPRVEARASRPGPSPLAPTDPTVWRDRPRPRFGAIMGGAALVAAVTTFAVVAALGGFRSHTHEREAISDETQHLRTVPATLAYPATPPPAGAPPPSDPVTEDLPPPSPTSNPDVAEATTSAPPEVEPEARSERSRPGDDAPARPTSPKRSTKAPRSKPSDPPGPPKGGASAPTPASDEPPQPAAVEAPPHESKPKAVPKASPGDLKDPFSSK